MVRAASLLRISEAKNDEKIINTNLYFTWKPSKHTHIEFGPSYSFIKQTDRSHERSGNWTVPAFEMVPSVLDSLDLYPETGWPGNRETLDAHQEQSSSNENNTTMHITCGIATADKEKPALSLRHQLSYHQIGRTCTTSCATDIITRRNTRWIRSTTASGAPRGRILTK